MSNKKEDIIPTNNSLNSAWYDKGAVLRELRMYTKSTCYNAASLDQ